MNIWLRLYIVDKREDESSVLNIFCCHASKFPGGAPLQGSFLREGSLLYTFNEIHQEGEKCEGWGQQRVCIKEL